jgi:hypothetical protein
MISKEVGNLDAFPTPQQGKMWILLILLGIIAIGFMAWALRAWLVKGWKSKQSSAPYRPGDIEWHRPGDKADKAPPSGEQEARPK